MENQLGQLLMIEVPRAAWRPSLERILRRFEPAGLLFREIATAEALAEVAQKVARALGSTPFLGIEDEGEGPLSSLFTPLPQTDRLNLDGVERAGDLIGSAMALTGLNLNLAPTVDLPEVSGNNAKSSSRSGEKGSPSRSLPLPVQIAHRGEVFLRGFAKHHVLACARHFPGLPASLRKSWPDPPVVTKSMAALWREDLVPYRTLRDEVPLIQVSHAAYKAYDYEFPRPASLSPGVVESLLRVKLGYRGVALSDVSAACQAARIEAGEALVQSLAAGCDLILANSEEPALEGMKDSLARALESGRLRPERVERALGRIKNAKQGLLPARRQPSERGLARLQHAFREFSGA
jgi:beta-N-acetylhexosaminidase